MDTFKLVKELLYLWVEKIVENLEKLTTDKQKEETKETKETKDAMLVGMAMNDDLPPVVVEEIHTMPSFKEENVKITSGEVWYKVKKMVDISKNEMERMKTKLWKNNNKDNKSRYNKKYYETHKEKIKELQKRYYEKQKQKRKQEQKDLEKRFNDAWEFSNNYSLLP